MARFSPVEVFQRIPCRLGEGPMWHASRQTFWWIDILGYHYYEARLDGSPARPIKSSRVIGSVVPTKSGALLAALEDGFYRVNPDTGAAEKYATAPHHDAKVFRFNDGKVDARGRFWAGSVAIDESITGKSRLYRLNPDKSVAEMRDGVSISNGIAWTADGTRMYYIDSPTKTVQEFVFDLEQGTISPPRVVITLGEKDGWPDGCAMDTEGCLWVAHWGASKVTRWKPAEGKLLGSVSIPVRNVTSCAFAGPKLDQLFITTAFDDPKAGPEPEAGFVFGLDPGVTGIPYVPFAGA